MDKPLVAHQGVDTGTPMKEFDPECELHYPLLIIKAVDPGCTLELQIENAVTGKVIRLTTTDDPSNDHRTFHQAVQEALDNAWAKLIERAISE